jgi:hypothetical protein
MKKTLLIIALFLVGFANSQAQYRPNMQLIVKGVINVPFYDPISENTGNSPFGGFQVEPVINLSSRWAVFGTFNYGFVSKRSNDLPSFNDGVVEYKGSTELSGWAGARHYFAPEDGRYIKVYVDLAAGVYSFNVSDAVYTSGTNPVYTKTFTYPSVTQIGLNIGSGINVNLNSSVFLNFGARMHNLFPKSNQQEKFTVVYSNGTQTEETTVIRDIPNNNYLQLTAGVGFRFGL